ncbi:DUF1090 domain-containing protein [Halomonas sp. KG2]|nr:DUF1090 domain-containing protein [Halomonas sp. KG2]
MTVLRQQLEHAQAHDNQHRVRGLQRALHSIEEHCTNEQILAEAAEEIRESQEEVRELEEHTEELDSLQHRLNE